jgi:hypothetical protein
MNDLNDMMKTFMPKLVSEHATPWLPESIASAWHTNPQVWTTGRPTVLCTESRKEIKAQ